MKDEIQLKWPSFGKYREDPNWKNANAFDEFMSEPVAVHVERMSEDAVYLGVWKGTTRDSTEYARFMFMVRDGKLEVEVY